MKKPRFRLLLLAAAMSLAAGQPPASLAGDPNLIPAEHPLELSHTAPAMPVVAPELWIPDYYPAAASSTVVIPVLFNSNGLRISSMGFSIDFDQTGLTFDPTEPFSVTFALPPNFYSTCDTDLTDLDGEIDCAVLDPVPPLQIIPDGVIASIIFHTGALPGGTILPINFSPDPLATFGDDHGAYVPGNAYGGSIYIVPPPDSPSELSLLYLSCPNVMLKWRDNSVDEWGFEIWRKTLVTDWELLDTIGPNYEEFAVYFDETVLPSTQYYYKVLAFNLGGDSGFSETASLTTGPYTICFYNYSPLVYLFGSTGGLSTISGIVKTSGGTPVEDAVVSDPVKGIFDVTGSDGAYLLSDLPADDYNLSAYREGYNCTAALVTVPPSAVGVDFTCDPAATNSISGRVLNNLWAPLSGVTVKDPAKGVSAVTDSGGYYTLAYLPDGSYDLSAYKEGYTCSVNFTNPVSVPPSAANKNFMCTPIPTCSNVVVNGGFEDRYGWEIPITEYTAGYSTLLSHTGLSSMRTGIVNPYHNRYSYSSARQLVTLPWDAASAVLRFYRYAVSGELPPSGPSRLRQAFSLSPLSNDLHLVLILESWDNVIGTLMWGLTNQPAWTYHEFSLLAYRGWTIKLYFGTVNDGWGGVSSMFVDDVSLEVCR